MRKNLTILIMILATWFLQTAVRSVVPANIATPDMILILTCSLGMMRGKKAGMLTGFISGLLYDLFSGSVFGLTALCLTYIGFGAGYLCRVFFDNDVRIPMAAVGIGELLYEMVLYIASLFMRKHIPVGPYLLGTVLPSVIISAICTIPLYYIYRLVNRSIAVYEEEAEQSPWLRR